MRTNLLLLAGQGKRFTEENYILPKPLISVDGVPMFILSAQHLPFAEKLIFVVAEYLKKYGVEAIINKYFPEASIVIQTETAKGQAHSVLQAESLIDPDSVLTVASCDCGPVYDKEKLQRELSNPLFDSLVWSFSNYPPTSAQPEAYGWIALDEDDFVKKIQYKIPLSDLPLNDNAVVGWFSYKRAKICFDNIKEMIAKDLKSGKEFSLDECTNVLISNGLKVKVFKIETFLSWGTPTELRTYKYWKKYFLYKKYSEH